MINTNRRDLTHDLILPTLLFAALGGMTWAVRGCSGYGAVPGCLFAGVTWGAAWWFIARDPAREQSRRYASGWVVLAVTVGVGLAGAQGWMQWPNFFSGRLYTNYNKGEFVPISRTYGFVWLFIAGMKWAGLGACLLAWCGSLRETRVWHWVIRLACGFGGAVWGNYLFKAFPQLFLPLFESLESQYNDLENYPSLKKLIRDCGEATRHIGFYLGFLLFEVCRREWKNVVLILTVGIVNGFGWALCQNWKWAPGFWENAPVNWWRCWESSGGISIGIAYGIAYFLVNRRMSDKEQSIVASRREIAGPNFEWLLVYFGLAWLLFLFLGFRMLEWGRIYFSVVILVGTAYYLMNRATAADETQRKTGWADIGANIEWGSVCLAAVLIGGLFIPKRMVTEYGMLDGMLYLVLALAAGGAWYMFRRTTFAEEQTKGTPTDGDPNLERLGLYLGLSTGLGLSIQSGLKGWFNIYKGSENEWNEAIWQYSGPVFLVCLIVLAASILFRPLPRKFQGNIFPHAYGLIWLVLIVQNLLAQLVTGPPTAWNEMVFSIYYVLLFAITATIVFHFHAIKVRHAP